jgi:hypothetical protein
MVQCWDKSACTQRENPLYPIPCNLTVPVQEAKACQTRAVCAVCCVISGVQAADGAVLGQELERAADV